MIRRAWARWDLAAAVLDAAILLRAGLGVALDAVVRFATNC